MLLDISTSIIVTIDSRHEVSHWFPQFLCKLTQALPLVAGQRDGDREQAAFQVCMQMFRAKRV